MNYKHLVSQIIIIKIKLVENSGLEAEFFHFSNILSKFYFKTLIKIYNKTLPKKPTCHLVAYKSPPPDWRLHD